MTSILCKALNGCRSEEILEVPSDFDSRIIRGELVRVRSNMVYYAITRIRSAAKEYLRRLRAENLENEDSTAVKS